MKFSGEVSDFASETHSRDDRSTIDVIATFLEYLLLMSLGDINMRTEIEINEPWKMKTWKFKFNDN